MKTVNIGTLKNQLSAYLRLVRDGEEVVVKDRDKPVARILPICAPATTEEEEAQLVAAGMMRLPQEEMDWEVFWALPMPAVSDEAAREAILWAKGYEK
jgi:prevent-host-death family protein